MLTKVNGRFLLRILGECPRILSVNPRLVAARRAYLGLTQQQLATRAGLHRSVVYDAEAGADVRLSTASKLAAALGVSLDSLLRKRERERAHA